MFLIVLPVNFCEIQHLSRSWSAQISFDNKMFFAQLNYETFEECKSYISACAKNSNLWKIFLIFPSQFFKTLGKFDFWRKNLWYLIGCSFFVCWQFELISFAPTIVFDFYLWISNEQAWEALNSGYNCSTFVCYFCQAQIQHNVS